MPLNVPKDYLFTPISSGETRIITRSARRSRLWVGGTFFRSVDLGEYTNAIRISLDENRDAQVGSLIVHNTAIVSSKMYFDSGDTQVEIFDNQLDWFEEIRIFGQGSAITSVAFISISRHLSVGEVIGVYGPFKLGDVIRTPKLVFRLTGSGLTTSPVIRPQYKNYPLTWITVDIGEEGVPEMVSGWSIDQLRLSVNADQDDPLVTMPARPSDPVPPEPDGEDVQDFENDAPLLSSFPPKFMENGEGLPAYPTDIVTGPDRALVHLNYAEDLKGSLSVINQILEWSGSSATSGSWTRYS